MRVDDIAEKGNGRPTRTTASGVNKAKKSIEAQRAEQSRAVCVADQQTRSSQSFSRQESRQAAKQSLSMQTCNKDAWQRGSAARVPRC